MNWMDTYTNLLEDENVDDDAVVKFIEDYKPQKLYRYRCYGKKWFEELYKQEIYMCNPRMFNDPFDSTLNVDFSTQINNIKDRVFGDFPIDKKYNEGLNKTYKLTDMLHKRIRESFRIACFTPFYNSMLMWSHYAASHTGYCIEYDVKKIDRITDSLYPVIYSSKRYDSTNYMTGSKNLGMNYLLHKAMEWNYENEWRIIATERIFNKEKGEYLELPDSISAIYLGVNSDERSEVKTIMNWAKAIEIPIYKMKTSRKQYKLIKERI